MSRHRPPPGGAAAARNGLGLGAIPGPSVCYTIASGLRVGAQRVALSVMGQAAANAVQLALVGFGVSQTLE